MTSTQGKIIEGVYEEIDEWLGIGPVGKDSPHFQYRTSWHNVSDKPPRPEGAVALITRIQEKIEANWDQDKNQTRGGELWRCVQITGDASGLEEQLERAIVKDMDCGGTSRANQIPTASGLRTKEEGRRSVDLSWGPEGDDEYTLCELKIEANNPLFAAMELFIYANLYIFARRCLDLEKDIHPSGHGLLRAKVVHLRTLAPLGYYEEELHPLKDLGDALNKGLTGFLAEPRPYALDGLKSMDFQFLAFDKDFCETEKCPDKIRKAMGSLVPVYS